MRSLGLTRADWDIAMAVLDVLSTYSRLQDEVEVAAIIELSGRSERQVRYTLSKLACGFVIVYCPGRGRGRLSMIGLPREGEWPACELPDKAADTLPLLPAEKGQRHEAKSGTDETKKRQATRTRTRLSSHTEKATEQDREAPSSERAARITDALCRSTNSTRDDGRVRKAMPILLDLVADLTDHAAVVEIERRADNLRQIYSNPAYVNAATLARDWPRAADTGRGISERDFGLMVAELDDPEVRRRL
jgi:hypothetical protein